MTSTIRKLAMLGLPVLAVLALALGAHAQTSGQPERFTAMAVNMDTGRNQTVEIVVNRWSTEKERDKLLSTLMDKGPEKLLDVLQDAPKVGYIRSLSSIGWDLHYARRAPMPEGGERVVIATDRPVSFWEASNQPRSIDYPFTVIEMHLNAEGEGDGTTSVATKITADKENKIITLENYGTTPVRLQNVKREKTSQ
jgi:hypothetical protein